MVTVLNLMNMLLNLKYFRRILIFIITGDSNMYRCIYMHIKSNLFPTLKNAALIL